MWLSHKDIIIILGSASGEGTGSLDVRVPCSWEWAEDRAHNPQGHFSVDKDTWGFIQQVYLAPELGLCGGCLYLLRELPFRIWRCIISAAGRKLSTVNPLRDFFSWRAPFFQQPTSSDRWMSGKEPSPLTPAQESSEGPSHLQSSPQDWLRRSLETAFS